MPDLDNYNKKDFATAQIALQLSEVDRGKHTSPVSDEALAALFDNRLDETHRQQVLDCIAIDNESYRRWIQLVEAVVSAPPELSIVPEEENKPTISKFQWFSIKKLSDWRAKKGNFSRFFGNGLIAASVILIVFMFAPTQQQINLSDNLDKLYNEFEINILTQSNKAVGTRDDFLTQRSIGMPVEKEEYIKIIQTGFFIGAINIDKEEYKKWGYKLKYFNIIKPAQLQKHTEQEFSLLFELGRLTALTAIPCSMNYDPIFIQSFYTLNKSLLLIAKNNINYKKVNSFANTFLINKNRADAVCKFSADIKQLIIH